jgi:hypothetical protein
MIRSLVLVPAASLLIAACVVEGESPDPDLDLTETRTPDGRWAPISSILTTSEAAGGSVFHPSAELAAEARVYEWIACDLQNGALTCSCGGKTNCNILVDATRDLRPSCNTDHTACTAYVLSDKNLDAILAVTEADGGHVYHTQDQLAADGTVKTWISCGVFPSGGFMCACGGAEDCKILMDACGDLPSSCNPARDLCSCWN